MWFKTTSVKDIDFRSFLKKEHRNMNWEKDVPRSNLEEKWKSLLKMI